MQLLAFNHFSTTKSPTRKLWRKILLNFHWNKELLSKLTLKNTVPACEQHARNSYKYKQFISHSLKYKQELQKFQMDISHFFIKPYWELWNLQVLQKLLTSSFSNFKHEKTSLNITPQSFQALKKTETKILFKEKSADYFKMHMLWDHQLCMCGYLQTGRSGGQSVQRVLHLLWHLSCLPGTTVLSPCFTPAFLCAAIETRYRQLRLQWYSSQSYLSVGSQRSFTAWTGP